MEATITMTGNVGSDIEHRSTAAGWSAASFRIACTPRVRRDGGWADAETTWVSVTCYRGLADNVSASLSKGDPVIVEGRLRTQVWNDKEGVVHQRLVLDAASVGHDLTRGTSTFVKSRPRAAVEEPPVGELLEAIESTEGLDAELEPVA